MPSEAVRRARQREYAATYRENKKDRRSPDRRDVCEAIGAMVMERARPGIERYVIGRLTRAGFDAHESEREIARLFREAAERASNAEIMSRIRNAGIARGRA